jgi:hypothetical protein
MKRNNRTIWQFLDHNVVYTVELRQDELICDCLEWARFDCCCHTQKVEKKLIPKVVLQVIK